MTEKHILIDINDEQSKYLIEVLGNKTSKKILNVLAEKNLSVSDLAKELSLPINTVDYNIKKLVKSGLIQPTKNFFWSIKGKRIPTYAVSKKQIIISPISKKKTTISLLAFAGLTTLATLLIKSLTYSPINESDLVQTINQNTPMLAEKSLAYGGQQITTEMAPRAAELAPTLADKISLIPSWEWFLLGTIFGGILIITIKKIFERR